MALPERVTADRLEGSFVDMVLILCPEGGYGDYRKGVVRSPDGIYGLLEGQVEVIGTRGEKSISRKGNLPRIIGSGVVMVPIPFDIELLGG